MSLLAVAGMFIFGGKKKKKSWAEKLQELSKKYGLPAEVIDALDDAHLPFNGYIEFVRRMDPEGNMERVKKTLDVEEIDDLWAARAVMDHEYHAHIGREIQNLADITYYTERWRCL